MFIKNTNKPLTIIRKKISFSKIKNIEISSTAKTICFHQKSVKIN